MSLALRLVSGFDRGAIKRHFIPDATLATTGFELVTKRTRPPEFLDEMGLVIPRTEQLALIAPYTPAGNTERPPFAAKVMLRLRLQQQFLNYSDPAMDKSRPVNALPEQLAKTRARHPRQS